MKLSQLATAVIFASASASSVAASYTYQEMPTPVQGINEFAASIDNTGMILTTLQDKYNLPIDLSLLPFDSAALTDNLTDLEAAQNGNFNLVDYTYLVNAIRTSSRSASQFSQQLAQYLTYAISNGERTFVQAFDTESDALGGFSFSLDTIAIDSANGTHIVGNSEGPFSLRPYVNEGGTTLDYVLSDYDQRAFVQVGQQVSALMPSNTTLGGVSRASAINVHNQVAGSASITTTTGFDSAIAACDDEETRGDVPLLACYQNIFFTSSTSGVVRRSDLFVNRATVWDVDASGIVSSQTTYGLTFEPDETQAKLSQIFSQALDINNAGVAVGASTVIVNETSITTAATSFENGVATRLIADDDMLPNSAVSINDEGYVVGIRQQIINSAAREKMFVLAPDAAEPSFIQGFFESSGTTPRAVNNNNIVVGYADIDAATTSTRRKVGFVYDIGADTFSDLNTMLACDVDFSVIEATDINDSNEIIATALAKRPQRDARGEILLNDSGEQILIDKVITLKLTPSDAPAPSCDDSSDDTLTERQGASVGFLSMGLLLMIAWRRRLLGV